MQLRDRGIVLEDGRLDGCGRTQKIKIVPMRRLPGPADSPLGDGGHTPEAHGELFRAGREHKLNLLCGLPGVLDSKWMCGSASTRNHRPRGAVA
jgi:hypothetical protein